jgi:hypothetical protein
MFSSVNESLKDTPPTTIIAATLASAVAGYALSRLISDPAGMYRIACVASIATAAVRSVHNQPPTYP